MGTEEFWFLELYCIRYLFIKMLQQRLKRRLKEFNFGEDDEEKSFNFLYCGYNR